MNENHKNCSNNEEEKKTNKALDKSAKDCEEKYKSVNAKEIPTSDKGDQIQKTDSTLKLSKASETNKSSTGKIIHEDNIVEQNKNKSNYTEHKDEFISNAEMKGKIGCESMISENSNSDKLNSDNIDQSESQIKDKSISVNEKKETKSNQSNCEEKSQENSTIYIGNPPRNRKINENPNSTTGDIPADSDGSIEDVKLCHISAEITIRINDLEETIVRSWESTSFKLSNECLPTEYQLEAIVQKITRSVIFY